MKIEDTKRKYVKNGDLFSQEYERENPILEKFKENYPSLCQNQTEELIGILCAQTDWMNKIFVADLLYLYDDIHSSLMNPLLDCAIHYQDPSFNKVFLIPCIRNFGIKNIAENLSDRFQHGDLIERINISKLIYWLKEYDNNELEILHKTVIERQNKTDNLIELYFYNLIYSNRTKSDHNIPKNADELIRRIKGNRDLEHILFNQLNWSRETTANNV
jgi:hypothetical protein